MGNFLYKLFWRSEITPPSLPDPYKDLLIVGIALRDPPIGGLAPRDPPAL